MSERISGLLEEIGSALRSLPNVFSTAQWGGRAYKLPGPGGNRRKPKLLAHVCTTKENDAVTVSFKLEKERADDVVERFAWIEPHSFGTLRPSGWLTARISQKRQAGVLGRLLAESRTLYPTHEAPPPPPPAPAEKAPARGGRGSRGAVSASAETSRLDRVMQEARESGWTPRDDDDFDR